MLMVFKARNEFKATALAYANLAFIKYWGKKDEQLNLPLNGSISVNLSNLFTITTVEFSKALLEDQIKINGKGNEKENVRVVKHLDRIRKIAGVKWKAKVVSENNFPKASGLASSASGFAALTLAATAALKLKLSERKLTILARLGSGSACRSIPDGFVEWKKGEKSETSYAYSIFPAHHWQLSIMALILKSKEKKISSSEGHRLAQTSPFLKLRLKNISGKIALLKNYLKKKDFLNFGQLIEAEALEMHAIMLTSNPPLIYWEPNTIEIIKFIQEMRVERLPVFLTIDAGAYPFLICEKKNEAAVLKRIKRIKGIRKVIINYPSEGAELIDNHLF